MVHLVYDIYPTNMSESLSPQLISNMNMIRLPLFKQKSQHTISRNVTDAHFGQLDPKVMNLFIF